MEGSQSKDGLSPRDPRSSKSPDSEADAFEDSSETAEQKRLRAAMLEWKKKGNAQLVEACAEALASTQSTDQGPPQDDEFTRKLKSEINQEEAEAEAERILRGRSQPEEAVSNERNSNSVAPVKDLFQLKDKEEKNLELKPETSDLILLPKNKSSFMPKNNTLEKITDTKFVLRLIGFVSMFELLRLFFALIL